MMYFIAILVYDIIVITSAIQSDEQPYCSLRYRRLCQGKGRHVACQFPLPGSGASCRNYTKIKFTNELRHFVTNYINRRRQRIASGSERVRGGAHLPRPDLMMLVTWDKELAYLAQRLADQCHFVHDDCRATVRYPYAGQSVGEVHWRGAEELSVQRAIRRVLDAWWGERRRVQPEQLTTPFRLTNKGSVWGHFSQLAVWSLRAVGCGAVIHGWDYTRLLLVCDFSHTNMLGQKTISPGPLAQCPIHTVRKPRTSYPLLCAPMKRSIETENEDDIYNDYKDEADNEQYETEKTEQTSVSTKKYSDSTRHNIISLPRKYTFLRHSVMSNRKTSDRLKQKLEQFELTDNVKLTSLRKYNRWESWPTRPDIREDQENKGEAKLFRVHKKFFTHGDDVTTHEYSRRVSTEAEYQSTQVKLESTSRHRWRQTRIKQIRPGANALLNKASGKPPQRPSIASLMIDQDDFDQLFKDTGFHVYWRKQTGFQ